jgi:hypothetical protein
MEMGSGPVSEGYAVETAERMMNRAREINKRVR